MSGTGYNEIIEYIAGEVIAFANNADEVEADVDRYMEGLTQAVQERAETLAQEENWDERSGKIVEGTYVSVWDGGYSLESRCRVNTEDRTIEILDTHDDDVEVLEREYVVLKDGPPAEYPAANESSRDEYTDEEQKGMYFYE